MSDNGKTVLRFWRVRQSECAEMVMRFPYGDGKDSRCADPDQEEHTALSDQERREAHDSGAGARWLPWGVRDWLGGHEFDLSRGARAGWADFASSVIRRTIVEQLWRLANRLERPLPPRFDAPEFHYAASVVEQANDALRRGYAAGKEAAGGRRAPGPLTPSSGVVVRALRGDLSVEELAQRLGVDVDALAAQEAGQRGLPGKTIEDVWNAVRVDQAAAV